MTESAQIITIFLELIQKENDSVDFFNQPTNDNLLAMRSESSSISQLNLLNFEQINFSLDSESSMQTKINKQNIIKNIIKGFLKYTQNIKKDEEDFNNFKLYFKSKDISIANFNRDLKRKMKGKNTRWNSILKSIMNSNKAKYIFCYYLDNKSVQWLETSKALDIKSHIDMINSLSDSIKNDIPIEILTYRKH